jgi:hypothetical protein
VSVILILNVLDAWLTLVYLGYGGVEANPIAKALLDAGTGSFVGAKSVAVGGCLLFLVLHKKFMAVRPALRVLMGFYGVLLVYHLYLQDLGAHLRQHRLRRDGPRGGRSGRGCVGCPPHGESTAALRCGRQGTRAALTGHLGRRTRHVLRREDRRPALRSVHARITPLEGERWKITDLAGHGVAVDGQEVSQASFGEGDVVSVAGVALRVLRGTLLGGAPAASPEPVSVAPPTPAPMPVAAATPAPVPVAAPSAQAPAVARTPSVPTPVAATPPAKAAPNPAWVGYALALGLVLIVAAWFLSPAAAKRATPDRAARREADPARVLEAEAVFGRLLSVAEEDGASGLGPSVGGMGGGLRRRDRRLGGARTLGASRSRRRARLRCVPALREAAHRSAA